MRLVTFRIQGPGAYTDRVGAIPAEEPRLIIDLNRAHRAYLKDEKREKGAEELASVELPSSMIGLLEGGVKSLRRGERAVEYALRRRKAKDQTQDGKAGRVAYATDEVKLLAPIPFPRLIMDFMAFEKHISNYLSLTGRTVPKEWYELPACYKKNPGCVIGPGETVSWPRYTKTLDFELEMAIYVWKTKNAPAGEGLKSVMGFSVFNDFSARDIQAKEMAVGLGPFKGKDFDTAGAFGPCLVTKDEVGDPQNLKMVARVNGEVWAEGSTKEMYWKINQLVEYASMEETLHPGYVLGTGTVGGGSGVEKGRFLKPNDIVELEIQGLGVLRNVIGRQRKGSG